jgi:hypothetical protein
MAAIALIYVLVQMRRNSLYPFRFMALITYIRLGTSQETFISAGVGIMASQACPHGHGAMDKCLGSRIGRMAVITQLGGGQFYNRPAATRIGSVAIAAFIIRFVFRSFFFGCLALTEYYAVGIGQQGYFRL